MTSGTAGATSSAPDLSPEVVPQALGQAGMLATRSINPAGFRINLLAMLDAALRSRHASWLRLGMAQVFEVSAARSVRYQWLDRLLPAYLFAMIAASKGWNLSSSLSRFVRGEIDEYTQLLEEARHHAVDRLVRNATAMGANAVLMMRFDSAEIGQTMSVALLGTYIMLPVALSGMTSDGQGVMLIADLLMIVGTGGAALALACLGSCFGIFPEARGLVTRGPYRYIRHPMYLFEFIAFLGVLLPALTALNLVLYLLFAALQITRMTFEERALAATFPGSYPAYFRRTARLIPGVY